MTLTAHGTLGVGVWCPNCRAEGQLELWTLLHDELSYASRLKVQLWRPHAAGRAGVGVLLLLWVGVSTLNRLQYSLQAHSRRFD